MELSQTLVYLPWNDLHEIFHQNDYKLCKTLILYKITELTPATLSLYQMIL